MSAAVDITINAQDNASSVFGNFTVTLGDVMNIAGKAASIVGGFFSDTITQAEEQQDADAQLQAGLESTGNVAGVTMQQMLDLADAQSKVTRFSDDQTEAIEKVALTFTSVNKDIFPDTIRLSEDMATRLGIQGTQAMTMIGKAMDDPIKGMGALHRVGVSFTEQQKDQIKALVAAGDTMGAQRILLGELSKEYGGSATAAGATFAGQQQILSHQFDEVKEKIGTALLPVLGQLTGVVTSNVLPVVEKFADWFAAKLPVAIAFVSDTVIPKLTQAWNTIQPTVQTVIAIISQVIQSFQSGGDGANKLGQTITTLQGYWRDLQPTITNVTNAVQAVVLAVFGQVQTFIKAHGADIAATMQDAWTRIQTIIKLGIELYNAIVPPVLRAIAKFINDHGKEIQAILSNTWSSIKAVIDAALTLIEGVIKIALDVIHGNWSQAWEDLKAMSARIVLDLWTVIKNGLDNIVTVFGGLWTKLKDAANTFITVTVPDIGKGIIDGIISGVSNGVGALEKAVEDAAQAALNAAKSALGIGSPSKVFADEVGFHISTGIAQGITQGAPHVRAALAFASAPGGAGGAGDTYNASYRGTVNIYPQAAQNPTQVARESLRQLDKRMTLRRA